MRTIRLLDARRGLNLKCRELFSDEKVAETIYRYLCNGIEECEDAEPQRKKGEWTWVPGREDEHILFLQCSVCHMCAYEESEFCPHCGADMRGRQDA